jgi:hypothetical protein
MNGTNHQRETNMNANELDLVDFVLDCDAEPEVIVDFVTDDDAEEDEIVDFILDD